MTIRPGSITAEVAGEQINIAATARQPRVWYGECAEAYAQGCAAGAAAERDRILREATARKATLVRPALGRDQTQEVDYIRLSVLADVLRGEPS